MTAPHGITPLERPEHCPGCYSLHMYCKYENPAHVWNEFPHEFGEGCETGGEARAIARRCGWILHRDGTATCPKCVRALYVTDALGRRRLKGEVEAP